MGSHRVYHHTVENVDISVYSRRKGPIATYEVVIRKNGSLKATKPDITQARKALRLARRYEKRARKGRI